MIVDTNVLSEVLRPAPSAEVTSWLRRRESTIHLSVVTVQELTFGVARMPRGARRAELQRSVDDAIRAFHGRVLPITIEVARTAGLLLAERLVNGRPLSLPDAQIAATALVHGYSLATRNVRDFEGLGLDVVNPWGDDGP